MIAELRKLGGIQSRDPSPYDSSTEQAITCVTLHIPEFYYDTKLYVVHEHEIQSHSSFHKK